MTVDDAALLNDHITPILAEAFTCYLECDYNKALESQQRILDLFATTPVDELPGYINRNTSLGFAYLNLYNLHTYSHQDAKAQDCLKQSLSYLKNVQELEIEGTTDAEQLKSLQKINDQLEETAIPVWRQ